MSQRVLLTGANGYIAQQVLKTFLEAGHSVRGVVRSQAKADQVSRTFGQYASSKQLDLGVVPDMTVPGAFDAVLTSNPPFDLVLHTASPYTYRSGLDNSGFLEPAVKGTTGILESIARVAPTVRRVVITSSMASIINFAADKITDPPKVYAEADWNPITYETALTSPSPNAAYQGSKKFAEKAAWDFIAEQKPGFDLVTLNPPAVFGPVVDPDAVAEPSALSESPFFIYTTALGPSLSAESAVPPTRLHLYVDVRDLAAAHLLAATVPQAGGRRFVVCGEQGHMTTQRICNILRGPDNPLAGRVPRGDPEGWRVPEGTFDASSRAAREVLGLRFRTPEETIGDLGEQIVGIMGRAGLV